MPTWGDKGVLIIFVVFLGAATLPHPHHHTHKKKSSATKLEVMVLKLVRGRQMTIAGGSGVLTRAACGCPCSVRAFRAGGDGGGAL